MLNDAAYIVSERRVSFGCWHKMNFSTRTGEISATVRLLLGLALEIEGGLWNSFADVRNSALA